MLAVAAGEVLAMVILWVAEAPRVAERPAADPYHTPTIAAPAASARSAIGTSRPNQATS